MTFEGNPWERMLIRGLRDNDPKVPIVGYQHSVVPQAWLAYFPGVYEATGGCLPDVVLTTGQKTKNILKRYGNYSNIKLRTCCALRYDYLHKLNPLARKTKQTSVKIIVALDGLMEVQSLVNYVLKQASQMDTVKFILRNHPANSSKSFLNYTREITNLVANIQLSRGTSVEEDISKCDLVLYWGTTVSLEAIMLGKPVVHFDRGDLLSHDPLFELEVFKWTVTPTQDLSSIIAEIQELSDEEYKLAQMESRSYVKDFFAPVNKEAMSLFLPGDISSKIKSLTLNEKQE
jgi:surface carbohydrate biosynthesis protein (TIGR04326 family)